MKLPFSFGLTFALRLLLPGSLLALAIYPLLSTIILSQNISVNFAYLFTISAVALGWIFVLSDMHIYMFYEGRRYWPKPLRRFFINLEKKRLKRLLKDAESSDSEEEIAVQVRMFAIDKDSGDFHALYPTRLGNLLASYEQYSFRLYGLYPSSFWRIWIKIDKDMRNEFDEQQAMADSGVYLSFCFLLISVLFLLYGLISYFSFFHIDYMNNTALLFFVSAISFILSFLIYRISLFAHMKFGEVYKSLFDIHHLNIKNDEVVAKILSWTGGHVNLHNAEMSERNEAIWNYTHNYRIRSPWTKANIPAPMWPEHLEEVRKPIET